MKNIKNDIKDSISYFYIEIFNNYCSFLSLNKVFPHDIISQIDISL